ncbi:hypothetical protein O3P69_007370 [Scylla paramamosain]|uniref:Uncharacterized protein n=1 Tax=Scylla paramamosain TaxID=85552 RepID=A0AAW0V7G6_SCYPA
MEQANKHFILRTAERISFRFDIYLGDAGGKRSRADHEDVNVEKMPVRTEEDAAESKQGKQGRGEETTNTLITHCSADVSATPY